MRSIQRHHPAAAKMLRAGLHWRFQLTRGIAPLENWRYFEMGGRYLPVPENGPRFNKYMTYCYHCWTNCCVTRGVLLRGWC